MCRGTWLLCSQISMGNGTPLLRWRPFIAGLGASTVAVTMNEILLRGCTLKNSGRVHGCVIYTGPESRIQMNAASPPRKLGAPKP